ncbi:MAG TPA: hypothetical protein ENI13_01420 [candidate division CPR3 bacterium]|uniref:Uncharacterized protein n=1 Tax=candidate division CPR3 bacterium TaxID=2268181 RepID=A0A7C1T230_UNCC3|nr:hypothetical protein [candidate division CPR3 bacterium]
MIKKLIMILAVLAIGGGGSCPALADTVLDHLGDAMTGRNDYIETSAYIAYTTKDTLSIKGIPIIPKGVRIKLGTPIGDGAFRSGTLQVGIEL